MASSKVHTFIGHPRSLCGLSPHKGRHRIENFQNFFIAPDADQCETCLARLANHGYSATRLRSQYRAVNARAQTLPLTEDASLIPYLPTSKPEATK